MNPASVCRRIILVNEGKSINLALTTTNILGHIGIFSIHMKEYPHELSLSEIWQHFEGFPLSHLATVEDDQPRVRMMALVAHGRSLWMATKTEWGKVEQIKRNPKVEISVPARDEHGSGCVRITALARLVDDLDVKRQVSERIPWFSNYWKGVGDPNFTLIGLDPQRILYDHPSDKRKYSVTLDT